MKINGTLSLTSALLLGGFFLVRGTDEFLQGVGYAFVLSACVVQLRCILMSIMTYRKRQLNES